MPKKKDLIEKLYRKPYPKNFTLKVKKFLDETGEKEIVDNEI